MSVIVFGANGMLGRYVTSYLKSMGENVIPLTRKEFDITTGDLEKCVLSQGNIKWIVNCAGVINKRTDLSVQEMYIVNSYFPHKLSLLCKSKGIRLLHPSTDCVFSGKTSLRNADITQARYSRGDFPDALDAYGMSKYLGESIDAIILRSSIIGSERSGGKSLLNWVVGNKGKSVNGYTNHYWNGVTCLEYAKNVYKLLVSNTPNGLYYMSSTYKNNPKMSKYDLIREISNVYNLNVDVKRYEILESIDRSLIGGIITKDIVLQLKDMLEWDESLPEFPEYTSATFTTKNNIFSHRSNVKISTEGFLVVITSAININHPYTIYTHEERFLQTLNTISTIRKQFNSSTKILLSDITLYQIVPTAPFKDYVIKLSELCDYVMLCEPETHGKSPGELTILKQSLSKVEKAKCIFKLSGRYYLTDSFTLNHFNLSKFNFKLGVGECYHTTFYNIPFDKKKFIENMTLDFRDIESNFFRQLHDVNVVDVLNCAGQYTYGDFYTA